MGLDQNALAHLRSLAGGGDFMAQSIVDLIDSVAVRVKKPARVASVSVNPASPGATVDGVTMAQGDRFLKVTDTAAANNGLWVWQGAAVAATRPDDFNSSLEVKDGTLVGVREGTYAGKTFQLVTDDPISLGTTTLRFVDTALKSIRVATVTPDVMTTADEVVVTKLAAPGAVAVTLPANAPVGKLVEVQDGTGDAGANNITITPAAGTVNGGANVIINVNYGRSFFLRTSTEWLAVLSTSVGAGAAGGDLSGNLPNPVVAKINGTAVAGASTATNTGAGDAGKVLKLDGAGKAAGRVLETDGTNLDALMTTQVLIATKTIANAALKTLNATPVEVIAAPAAGKYLELVSVHARVVFAGAAFDGVDATDYLELRNTNAAGELLTQNVNPVGFADQGTTQSRQIPLKAGSAAFVTPQDAANVVAHIAGTEWFTAAGGGSLHLEVLYRVRTTAI